jgi:hypothetical protein
LGKVRAAIVLALLFTASIARAAPCTGSDDECQIATRYAGDAKAAATALALFRESADTADVGSDEQMDGGYRGTIHLVPALPIGDNRQHLAWTLDATRAIAAFFAAQFPEGVTPPAYRWRGLAFHYVRSVGKRTPSAYAIGWSVTYNVSGSLLTSADSVLETLFHELFHSNDDAHGDWSAKTLATDYAAILKRCGAKPTLKCLAPYAPGTTIVRGGTYYAFQQDNGNSVHEYAAELAVRYFREQHEMQTAKKLVKPAFKCGPAENGRAWKALIDEFFAGRDLVPDCGRDQGSGIRDQGSGKREPLIPDP